MAIFMKENTAMTSYQNAPPPSADAAAAAASLLADHPDFRILRCLGEARRFISAAPANTPTRVAAIVDVETTGLDIAKDRIIELAVQRLRFTDAGQITEVGIVRVWHEDPKFALDPAIVKLTGLTDADLAGKVIDDIEATAMLVGADVIIAHNASFDARFIEARLRGAAGLNWACTMTEVDWAEYGFAGGKLGHLLMEAGYFFTAHRADQDVLALIHLLAHQPSVGFSVLADLIARAEQPSTRIDALGAPFAQKNVLKARGYHWEPECRFWWTEVIGTDVDTELLWLQRNGCDQGPRLSPVTWRERHR